MYNVVFRFNISILDTWHLLPNLVNFWIGTKEFVCGFTESNKAALFLLLEVETYHPKKIKANAKRKHIIQNQIIPLFVMFNSRMFIKKMKQHRLSN